MLLLSIDGGGVRRGVNSAVEEQRVKLRFSGASCQSEEPWSAVAMVTGRRGRGEALQDVAGECLHE